MNSKNFLLGLPPLILLLTLTATSNAQVIRAGLKAGAQLSWLTHDDKQYLEMAKVRPHIGFNAGAVLAFKVRDRFFLHTEYVYSQKGKNVKGKEDRLLEDKVVYHYVDLPILFTRHFKAKLKNGKNFKWYIGAGPTISYWLGGKGTIMAGDLDDNDFGDLKYKMKFGTRDDSNSSDPWTVYIKNANRLQFAMNVGAGILLEPAPKRKIMIDLRYEMGHTRLGEINSADFILPSTYDDNLKARTKGFQLSLIYLAEYNLNKKSRNKGKSTLKE